MTKKFIKYYRDREEYAGPLLEHPATESQFKIQSQFETFTKTGYRLCRVPERIFTPIQECFLDEEKHYEEEFTDPKGYTGAALTHADWHGGKPLSERAVTRVGTRNPFFKEALHELLPLHEEWAGVKLKEAAVFGPRVYCPGAALLQHVDTITTHIISSSMTIAEDVDEPWPLVLENRAGEIIEAFIPPGFALFYEGAFISHGRPLPLKGRYFANMYFHYTPTHWQCE